MNSNNKYNPINDPYFDEVKSKTGFTFDFVLWFYRILKYWYLFLISILICLIIANIKNRSWTPRYGIQALMMLEDRGNVSPVSGAVPMGTILRNAVNQQIVLKSRGMIERTVNTLPPRMWINYFRISAFKSVSLYANTPVEILSFDLKPEAYFNVYGLAYVDDEHCQIYYEAGDNHPSYSIVVPYDKIIDNGVFKIKLKKTVSYEPNFESFNFKFLTKEHLINSFYGRVSSKLLETESSALALYMAGDDPARDMDFMSNLLDEFQNYNLSLKNYQADLTINFIDKQLVIIEDSLENSRIRLDNFQKQTGVYEVKSSSLRDEIGKIDKQQEDLAIREKAVLVVTDRIVSSLKANEEIIDPEIFGLQTNKLSRYIAMYNETLKKSQLVGVKNPTFEKTLNELNDQRELILAEIRLIQSNVLKDKEEIAFKNKELEDQINNLPPQERVLIKYQRLNRLNEVYQQYLNQRRYEANIQRASNTPDNFILEEPRVITSAINGGELGKNYTFFLVVGFLIPLIFVVLKEEILNFTISSKEECERISGLPVISTIENVSKKAGKGVVLVRNYPKSSFAESFRNLRVRIEYMAQKESHLAILITSTEPSDGKTFIATNIASVYQLMGKKVVLLDLDLRRPSVAKTLKMQASKGVSNYLIGQVTLDEIIIKHPKFGFDVITAGTLPPNPSELIKTSKTEELIKYLQDTYDYLIIDCSPIGLVSDAYILAKIVNTTMFVVRKDKTSKSFFKSVINQIKFDEIDHIAIVFNDVKGREGYYGTSRYYGDKTYNIKKNSYYHDDYYEE